MSLLLDRDVFGDTVNKGNVLSSEEATSILNDWVKNKRLQLHMKQVEAVLDSWAKEKENLNADDAWRLELAGLLHDADCDQWPDLHCKKIIEELENRNIDPEIIHAIASHGPLHFGVEPQTKMDKM